MLLDDLSLIKCIGAGTFGEVYLTSKKGSENKLATKKISKKYMSNPKYKKYIENEINILKGVSHSNIIKLYEVKETPYFYFLVMELCNGGNLSNCLEEYINKYKNPFSEEIVQFLMYQIISAIKYLHNKNILHRDIKLDNILINFESEIDKNNLDILKATIKIIDFGFARHLSSSELASSILGSPLNMDPGILEKLIKLKNKMDYSETYEYDQKADIWSLGTICYQMLTGKSAFEAKNLQDLVNKIEVGKYFLSTNLSKETCSFLNGMLKYDLKKRLTADQLLEHPFLRKPYNLFTKISDNYKEIDFIEINIKKTMNFKIPQPKLIGNSVEESEESEENKKNEENEENENNKNNININNLFLDALYNINDDFIYIEPLLIPIIYGNKPNTINNIFNTKEEEY